MRVILLGPPGAGKGTQAAQLADSLRVPHISTGEMLRDQVRLKTELGLQVQETLAAGRLVGDKLMIAIVQNRLKKEDCHRGFILDGFPRSVIQAEALTEILRDMRQVLNAVIELELADAEIVHRLSARRVCGRCGTTYHLINKRPKVAGVCDIDGADLVQREDDQELSILTRLQVYHRETQPVSEYYRVNGRLKVVDASGSIDDVLKAVLLHLRGMLV